MNAIEEIKKKTISRKAISYGISPLHLLINSLEFILHLSYRLPLKKWAIKGVANKKVLNARKQKIKEKLRKKLGILVDSVSHGNGLSNTGNVARKFFNNYEISAEITEIDMDFLKRLHIILLVLNSGFEIDSKLYRKYAYDTASIFSDLYPWFHMPASTHKVLKHGDQVIEELPVSLGHSSEEAIEATHKKLRSVKEHHTLKTSRKRINEDLVHWMLTYSDPMIASLRKRKYQPKSKPGLPQEGLQLLRSADPIF